MRLQGWWSSLASACVLAWALGSACSSPERPSPFAEFVVDVAGERFVIRTTDPETIQLADDNRRGLNQRFPMGSVKSGDSGFNSPWTWHLDPSSVRFVEVAIELCDGRPSDVEARQSEYSTYCPWGARVVSRR